MKLHRNKIFILTSFILVSTFTHQQAQAQDAITSESRQQVFLSLNEALSMALENNLDISIERLNPEIQQEAITEAESAFDSTTTSEVSHTFLESESASTPANSSSFEVGIGKRFGNGASYELGLQLGADLFDGSSAEDEYATELQLTLTQPLLRDFGAEVNMTDIRLARKNYDIALSELRAQVIDVVSEVQNAYWEVVNARADLTAATQALQLAKDQLAINEAEVRVGTLAPLEVLQARATVASRKVDVTTAELSVLNAEDDLKLLLNFDDSDPIWEAALTLTDDPLQDRYTIGLKESISTALLNREELQQLQDEITLQELSLRYAENQRLPGLNLVGALELGGSDDNVGGSMSAMSSADELSVTFGAEFSYSLGNRAAKSAVNSARLELDLSRLSLRNQEQTIAAEVRVAHRNVTTAYELIESTRVARELAEEQLKAEQKKYDEGLSTNFQVLEYQDELTQARSTEAQAITSYNQALVSLDQAIGMTLQRHNILLEE